MKNRISDIEENIIIVINRQYIDKLIEAKIPYFLLNDETKICGFIKKSNNGVIFNKEDCQKIRKLAREYHCSTKIIYKILKDLLI